jgi:hypothetical protein
VRFSVTDKEWRKTLSVGERPPVAQSGRSQNAEIGESVNTGNAKAIVPEVLSGAVH